VLPLNFMKYIVLTSRNLSNISWKADLSRLEEEFEDTNGGNQNP